MKIVLVIKDLAFLVVGGWVIYGVVTGNVLEYHLLTVGNVPVFAQTDTLIPLMIITYLFLERGKDRLSVTPSLLISVLLVWVGGAASFLLQEGVHALVMSVLGQSTFINLAATGAVTAQTAQVANPYQNILLSISGPITNLILVWILSWVTIGAHNPNEAIRFLRWMNLILVIFNGLPINLGNLTTDGYYALLGLFRLLTSSQTAATITNVASYVAMVWLALTILRRNYSENDEE